MNQYNITSSLLFRCVLILYGVYISLSYDHVIPWWGILIITILYFLVFIVALRDKSRWLRFINDIIFIVFVTFGLPIFDVVIYLFLLLHVINVPNHTQKGRPRYYYFAIFSYLIVNLFYQYTLSIENIKIVAIPFLAAILVAEIFNIKNYIIGEIDSLSNGVYDFYGNRAGNKTHKVLKDVVSHLNTSIYKNFFKVDRIILFKENSVSDLSFIVASEFTGEIVVQHSSKIIENIKANGYSENNNMRYDGITSDENFWFYIKNSGDSYIIAFTGEWENTFMAVFSENINRRVIYPTLLTFAKLLNAEKAVHTARKEYLDKNADQLKYIKASREIMHFVRNKLSPIGNYFELLDEVNKGRAKNNNHELKQILEDELKVAKKDYKAIMNRVKTVLDKKNDPLTPTNIEKTDIRYIVTLIRSCWNSTELNDIMRFSNYFNKNRIFADVDREQLEFVITDIVTNIDKYRFPSENYEVKFRLEADNCFEIIFSNGYSKENLPKLKELATYFNSDSLAPLEMGDTSGLLLIKSNLSIMDIDHKIELDRKNDKFSLHIKFNCYE